MKLIETYQNISKREILDCRIKSIKELVRHYNLDLNSYEVLLLSEAYSFMYTKIKIPNISIESFPYATVSHNDLEINFFNNLNINYKKENIYGNEDDWIYIKKLIDENNPILFKIDSRFLMGVTDAAPKQTKLNLYYLSTLLLAGYDENKGEALIVLTNDDKKEGINKISLNEFQKYRCSICIPFSPDGLCFYLDNNNRINKINCSDIKIATLNSLRNLTDIMLNEGKIYDVSLGKFIGSDVTKGIYGMQKLREEFQIMLEHYDGNYSNQNKLIQLMMIFLRNNMMFGSYSAFREEFGQCLKVCAMKYNIKDFDLIGNNFELISRDWKHFFSLLSSIAHIKTDILEKIKMVIKIWNKIIIAEKEQYLKIKEIL